MQNFSYNYPKLSSAIHTFLATFLVTFVAQISVIPVENILSSATWTTAFVSGVIVSAVRAGIKSVSPLS